jgi:polyferredoxin
VLTYGSALRTIPVFAVASVLAVGVVLGRLVCGFLCPFGFLQDLLHRIPTRKIRLPQWVRYGKYATLGLLVFVLPWMLGFETSGYLMVGRPEVNAGAPGMLDVKVKVENLGMEDVKGVHLDLAYIGVADRKEVSKQGRDFPEVVVHPGQTVELPHIQLPNQLATAELAVDSPQSTIQQTPRYLLYFCKVCPSGTLTATLPALAKGDAGLGTWGGGLWLRLGILGGILVLMVVAARPFCRMFCPLGAMYGLMAPAALTRMKIDRAACVACGLCDKACPVELNVLKEIGGRECIACGDCKKACPKQGIHRVFGV